MPIISEEPIHLIIYFAFNFGRLITGIKDVSLDNRQKHLLVREFFSLINQLNSCEFAEDKEISKKIKEILSSNKNLLLKDHLKLVELISGSLNNLTENLGKEKNVI